MLNIKGIINKNGEIVFPHGKSLHLKTLYQEQTPQLPIEINIELSISINLNRLISGIDRFIWATKDIQQTKITCNTLKIQKIESEIVNIDNDNNGLYLIKVTHEEDIKEVIGFIQNDVGGLRLKPDWN